jgi:FdhD protein
MNRSRPLPPDAAPAAPDESHAGFVRRPIRRFRSGKFTQLTDAIAEEVPIALVYNDRPHVVMMATPRDLDDFALGFSLSEAVIGAADELEVVETQTLLEGIEVRLRIPETRAEALESRHRNLTGRTSCGLCGAQALEDAVRQPPAVGKGPQIDSDILHRALAQMHDLQPLNVATGATHAAAWVHVDGHVALLREDVGRHNALDKLIGAMTKSGERVDDGFLVVTSRASYEMVQKSATVGIALLAAISAPTALAIHLAEETGMTLIGFARPEGHVVYANPERITRAATGIPA